MSAIRPAKSNTGRPPRTPRQPGPPIKSHIMLAEVEFKPKRGGHAFRKRHSYPER
jgi:hypothetical protein